jgi:hypothetical protein
MMEYFRFNNVLAKLTFLILAVVAVQYHLAAGIVILLLFIFFNQNVIEGMESSMEEDSNSNVETSKDSLSNFKNNNCVNGKLMKDDKEITPNDVKESFPNIKFTGDVCNPCDEDCKFEIISTDEQLTVEENLKAKDSTSIPIDRESVIKKNQ